MSHLKTLKKDVKKTAELSAVSYCLAK